MATTTDRRAVLHIAGEKPGPEIAQRCTRCKTVMARKGTTGWKPGAVVVSYGRGDWSVLEYADRSNPHIHRLCVRKG